MLDNTQSLGVSVGGNGGMNTDYPIAVFGNFAAPGVATAPTSIDMMQVFIGLNYARKFTPNHALGIAPVLAVQRVKIEGLEPFKAFSSTPNAVTNNGYDYSYGGGVELGWHWIVNNEFSFGASYRSRLIMTPFDRYKGLFAESGHFDIPPILQAGVAFKPQQDVVVALDVQHIFFGDIKAISNNNGVAITPGSLGTDHGLGFGWDDMTVYKMGIQWQANKDWTLRAGYSIANEVIPNQQALFNVLAPATVTQHLALGLSWAWDAKSSLNLAATHAFDKRVHGSNPNTPFQTGSLDMYQNELEISWSYRF